MGVMVGGTGVGEGANVGASVAVGGTIVAVGETGLWLQADRTRPKSKIRTIKLLFMEFSSLFLVFLPLF